MKTKRRISRVFYYEGISLGLLLGSICFGGLELLRRKFQTENITDSPWLVIIPAFLAAYVSLRALGEQSRQSQDIEIEKYERLERGARADLPISISELKSLCDQAVTWHFCETVAFPSWRDFEGLLYKLRGTIEYSDRENAEYLLKTIRHYQVLFARGRRQTDSTRAEALSDAKDITHCEHWYSAMNWAVLGAMVENVFDYARGTAETIDTTPVNERVRSQFFSIVHFWDEYPFLNTALELRENEDRFEMNFAQ